jgi:hypothetical protein
MSPAPLSVLNATDTNEKRVSQRKREQGATETRARLLILALSGVFNLGCHALNHQKLPSEMVMQLAAEIGIKFGPSPYMLMIS